MKQSLSYYICLFIIRLKGIKSNFSKDPINLKKVRKGDIHHPKTFFYQKNSLRRFTISDSSITEVATSKNSEKLVLFIHGGAFISGPKAHHWNAVKNIAKNTNHAVWMCDYPKAPESNIEDISRNIDAIYATAVKKYPTTAITLLGDSAGGTLITTLVQRLLAQNCKLPKRIILVSPVMDATFTNPAINAVDKTDPILSKKGVFSAKKLCANDRLKDPIISPNNGDYHNFPPTFLFLAENDITYPDQLIALQKLQKAKVAVFPIFGYNMPHIWPFLPVMKEARVALQKIISILNQK
ncbi:alpha/beta hydrolase [Tenacibaculum sp. SG-28]|uniref:alpha/beta hydrolase n=1 Tax=Tenacibaculum sp. SG-28 TaxID=754426 RepID=UPI000CF47EC1|nr:alpha/beta hydrolase [Tenacibaculum sp. SG-28]PQJ21821.1 esterase [Tenacibaculum sp. SG-28]